MLFCNPRIIPRLLLPASLASLVCGCVSSIQPAAMLPASAPANPSGVYPVGFATRLRIHHAGQVAPQQFACDCKPYSVAPLSGAGVFRNTGADSGPIWIFNAAAHTPRTLLIPASASVIATKAGSN